MRKVKLKWGNYDCRSDRAFVDWFDWICFQTWSFEFRRFSKRGRCRWWWRPRSGGCCWWSPRSHRATGDPAAAIPACKCPSAARHRGSPWFWIKSRHPAVPAHPQWIRARRRRNRAAAARFCGGCFRAGRAGPIWRCLRCGRRRGRAGRLISLCGWNCAASTCCSGASSAGGSLRNTLPCRSSLPEPTRPNHRLPSTTTTATTATTKGIKTTRVKLT